MRTMRYVLVTAALGGLVSAASGQAAAASTAAAPTSGYRAEFLNEMKYFEGRFTALAQAIPAEKYAWRPGPGVRSVAEVLAEPVEGPQARPVSAPSHSRPKRRSYRSAKRTRPL